MTNSLDRFKSSEVFDVNYSLRSEDIKLHSSFVEFVSVFLKGTCSSDCFPHLPSMLGNGHSVDVLKLYVVVKQKGGFEEISKNGLWDEVGLLFGLKPGFGSSIKLIYLKYLESLESWLSNLSEDKNLKSEWSSSEDLSEGGFMEPDTSDNSFVSNITEKTRKIDEYLRLNFEKSDISFVDLTVENSDNNSNRKKIKMNFSDVVDLTKENYRNVKSKRKNMKTSSENDVIIIEENHAHKNSKRARSAMSLADNERSSVGRNVVDNLLKRLHNSYKELMAKHSTMLREEFSDHKREDDCLSRMLLWLSNVAKDPTNPAFGMIPENSRWAFYGKDNCWKQVLLAREALFQRRAQVILEENHTHTISSVITENSRSSVSPNVADNVLKSSEIPDASKKCSTEDEEMSMIKDSNVLKEEVSGDKRKHDCQSRMLSWLANVAKDPTDPVIGVIPENSRWAFYGKDNCWKQVLLAREALFLKRAQVSSSEQSVWQKKQKMHPSMFDDQLGSSVESPRFSLRQRWDVRIDLQPTASIYTTRPLQRIPIGREFQAEIPEWTGVSDKSESKWLGNRVWPLVKREPNFLIERDPIGKGRVDTCGCEFPGSTECVKFHVAERRTKMMLELGSLFFTWKFNKMGEACSVSWTGTEETKFKALVKENPLSLQKYFQNQMVFKVLPTRSWTDMVNYYFNVFVLRRRGSQNRHTPTNIDSDDDETEYVSSTTNGFGHDSSKSRVSISSSKKARSSIK